MLLCITKFFLKKIVKHQKLKTYALWRNARKIMVSQYFHRPSSCLFNTSHLPCLFNTSHLLFRRDVRLVRDVRKTSAIPLDAPANCGRRDGEEPSQRGRGCERWFGGRLRCSGKPCLENIWRLSKGLSPFLDKIDQLFLNNENKRILSKWALALVW